MSVYKRHGAETYSYDFQIGGHRFSGDTGRTSKREAAAVERLRRETAKAEVTAGIAFDQPDTWQLAASRYWIEVGQHHVNSDTTLKSLAWLTKNIGATTPLDAIDDNLVAGLVARRRAETRQVGTGAADRRPIAPATVNRTMTEPLRKVLLRAARVWKVRVGDVAWRQHMLREPKERVREASQGEEAAIMAQLERGYDDAVRFALLSACRRKEIVSLEWTSVDFSGRQFEVIGKGSKRRTIPMSDAIYGLLWSLRGQHERFVFSFVAQKTRREWKQVRGRRYPIKADRLSHVLRQAAQDAGVGNFHLHDTRHTVATRTLRRSNMRVVQNLLGHEDVSTTAKYAHAVAEDIRAALNAISPTGSPTGTDNAPANNLDKKGKFG